MHHYKTQRFNENSGWKNKNTTITNVGASIVTSEIDLATAFIKDINHYWLGGGGDIEIIKVDKTEFQASINILGIYVHVGEVFVHQKNV